MPLVAYSNYAVVSDQPRPEPPITMLVDRYGDRVPARVKLRQVTHHDSAVAGLRSRSAPTKEIAARQSSGSLRADLGDRARTMPPEAGNELKAMPDAQ